MNRHVRRLAFALTLVASLAVSRAARAQDPVPLYPENYTVLFENDRVRVLDFRLRKGATEKLHSHPANVALFLTDVKIRFTLGNGETRLREARAGEVSFSEATSHSPVNVGESDAHGILVELKTPLAAATAPPRSDGLTAVTLIHGIPGKEEELRDHLLSLAGPTRAEAGSRIYDLYQSPDQKHEFMRFEVWESPEALEDHKKKPYLRTSFEKRQREGWTTQILTWTRVPEPVASKP